jgi:hypothetical protein
MGARRYAENTGERRVRMRGATGEVGELMRVANAPLQGSGALAQRARGETIAHPANPPQALGELIRVDERVLDDLSHELGNFFHKLYYWSDYIKSGADDLGPDSSASHMLDRTIHHLEDFLKVAMEYFQPVRLTCIQMTGPELAGAVEALLRAEAEGERTEVSAAEIGRDTAVMVDPRLFSDALRIVIRQVRSASQSGAPLFGVRARLRRAERTQKGGLEIEIDSPAGVAGVAPRKGSHVLEWAVAKKFIEMHGGELFSREQHGTAGCVLFLPLCS